MKIWVGVTDNKWFDFLSRARVDEVNFWQPSGTPPFTHLPPGTPFLFKLKRPYNHIAGGGFFVKFISLPLLIAWETFGSKNGAASFEHLELLVSPLVSNTLTSSHSVGCTILATPFFFRQDDWIEAPGDWSSNIVRGKTYDSGTDIGEKLWSDVQQRLPLAQEAEMVQESPAQYGESFLSRARLGQGAFRVLVTEAYKRKCAITGESTLPVLEAAHIKPFSRGGYNNAFNGLLLRSDFHKLFDVGLVTVTPELNIEVSQRIREEWFNGKVYYRLHGQRLAIMPEVSSERPRQDLLRWHNDNVFVG